MSGGKRQPDQLEEVLVEWSFVYLNAPLQDVAYFAYLQEGETQMQVKQPPGQVENF